VAWFITFDTSLQIAPLHTNSPNTCSIERYSMFFITLFDSNEELFDDSAKTVLPCSSTDAGTLRALLRTLFTCNSRPV
jgi:hypothetical protein